VGGYLEECFCGDGVEVEVEFDLFAALLDKVLNRFLLCLFVELAGDLLEVFVVELLSFGLEYLLQDLIYLLEVAHLHHPVCLVDHQVLEMLEAEH